jgi:hypothetical protein
MRLAGKVAIISGAASGMGAATARVFAREGAKVVIAERLARRAAAPAGCSRRCPVSKENAACHAREVKHLPRAPARDARRGRDRLRSRGRGTCRVSLPADSFRSPLWRPNGHIDTRADKVIVALLIMNQYRAALSGRSCRRRCDSGSTRTLGELFRCSRGTLRHTVNEHGATGRALILG